MNDKAPILRAEQESSEETKDKTAETQASLESAGILAAFEALPDKERGVKQAVWVIQKLKELGDEEGLIQVRRALDRKYEWPRLQGQKTANYASWKVQVLRRLAKGFTWRKAIMRSMNLDAAHREIRDYCLQVYRFCQIAKRHTPDDWSAAADSHLLRFMLGLDLPGDSDALVEAYRRGQKLTYARSHKNLHN